MGEQMAWIDELSARLAAQIPCGYHPAGAASSEPTALAALALLTAGRRYAALRALTWLASCQAVDGSIGPTAKQSSPGWTTGWALLAALADRKSAPATTRTTSAANQSLDIDRAIIWLLQEKGQGQPRTSDVGHDNSLVGWPWVDGTHSWVEPTAISVLALKAAGDGQHPRVREAIFLLTDRLLTGGGCNYGNTIVLGQELRPHVQPSGLAMLALAGEPDGDGRIARTLDYLTVELSPRTTSASLAFGLLGLAAHGRLPANWLAWLESAYRRTIARNAAAYPLALLALAALGADSPLITLPATAVSL